MPKENTLKLNAVAKITGRSRSAILNMISLGQAPWDESQFQAGSRRSYGTEHALALFIAESLARQGLTNEEAGFVLREYERVIALFLDDIDRALESPVQRLVAASKNAWWDAEAGVYWELSAFTTQEGLSTEARDHIAREIEAAGLDQRFSDGLVRKQVQGPVIVCQSVNSAYWLLVHRAAECGYLICGRNIFVGPSSEAPE
ncbi:MAG: hypothetical protein EA339_13415 [Rhodobacteraceae bacterium]|nr:MAG: hypothetical protein EA339_13415 [Paracoccaceae bacterium]